MDSDSRRMESRFIDVLENLRAQARENSAVTLKTFVETMGTEGHAILLIFLCLPYFQPIPIPGLSTPCGILMALVALLLYLDRPTFLPKRFHHLKMSSELILKIIEVAEKIWMRVHRKIYARWEILFEKRVFRILNMMVVVVNALLLALPLPIPFSNTIPSIAILLNSLGQMEKDGVFVVLSYLGSLLSFAFFMALSLGTVWGIRQF